MANFTDAYKIIAQSEGGYLAPSKSVAETYKGIDRKANPNWPGWAKIDKLKPATTAALNLMLASDKELQADIINFYLVNYWNTLKLSQVVDQNIANTLADCSVNQGVGIAARFAQLACNKLGRKLAVDGQIGSLTLFAINNEPVEKLYNIINELRRDRYIDTANNNPELRQWLKGWLKRLVPYNHDLV
jgi:lysozyme family protein